MTKTEFEKKYKIIKKLAEGGQGEVFLAQIQNEDLGFVREVAIKFFHKNSSTKETALNEIKILTMLKHPNICQILDVGEFEERYFVVLEYVDGISLKAFKESLLKKGLKINDGALFEIANGCFSTLKYSHHLREGKVLHHDVSPHNMMITSDGHIKLIDFGIAQIFNENKDQKIQGKPAYLPSAVLAGDEKYSAKSEIYSLGIVLVELMFGRRFDEKTLKDKLNSCSESLQYLISNLLEFEGDYGTLEKFIKRELTKFESNFSELVKKCTDDQYIADKTLIDVETYDKKDRTEDKNGLKSLVLVATLVGICLFATWFSYRPNEYDKKFIFIFKLPDGQEQKHSPPKKFLNSSQRDESNFSNDSCEMSCLQASVNLTLGHKISIEKMKKNGVLEEEYRRNTNAFHNHTLNLYRKTFDNIQKNIRLCSHQG
ncbi:MAG: serine/threonine-protein kinase, partial [Bacteriovoracia bacterium]